MSDLDIGDIHNGDQDALSFCNEWAILILTIFNMTLQSLLKLATKSNCKNFTTHGDLAIITRSLAIKIVYMEILANLRLAISNCTGDLFS